MPGNFKKQDLRIIKTRSALLNALPSQLQKRSFTHLTVNDLCEEAQLSRTAFYMHFKDKYDLLENMLEEFKNDINLKNSFGTSFESAINHLISGNKRKIKNLLENADHITIKVIEKFLISILAIPKPKDAAEKEKYIILSNFCGGGILNLIKWQIENNFPTDTPIMNNFIMKILNNLRDI